MTEVIKEAVEAIFGAFRKAEQWYSHEMSALKLQEYLKDAGFTIARAEPVGFEAAIKQLGEPDVATGHWSLDEGNLRWFVGQCKAEPAMTEAELESKMKELSWVASTDWGPGPDVIELEDAIELAKKYRGK